MNCAPTYHSNYSTFYNGLSLMDISSKIDHLYFQGGTFFHPAKLKSIIPEINDVALDFFKQDLENMMHHVDARREFAIENVLKLTAQKFPEYFI